MTTVTPGTWTAIAWTCHAKTTVVADLDGVKTVVAECSGHGRYADESVGDALLISLSKEMFAELEAIANANPKNWEAPLNDAASFQAWAQSRARAVIAKFTGAPA
jgi:hypothetical protein